MRKLPYLVTCALLFCCQNTENRKLADEVSEDRTVTQINNSNFDRPQDPVEGLQEFVSRYRCAVCHSEYTNTSELTQSDCQSLLSNTVAVVVAESMPLGDENVSESDRIVLENLVNCRS